MRMVTCRGASGGGGGRLYDNPWTHLMVVAVGGQTDATHLGLGNLV